MLRSPNSPLFPSERLLKHQQPIGTSQAVGLAALVVITVAIITLVSYAGVASTFNEVRTLRNEFAFQVPTTTFPLLLITWIGCASIMQAGRWALATFLMLVLSAVLVPPIAYSGPGYMYQAVEPLVNVRAALFLVYPVACAFVSLALVKKA